MTRKRYPGEVKGSLEYFFVRLNRQLRERPQATHVVMVHVPDSFQRLRLSLPDIDFRIALRKEIARHPQLETCEFYTPTEFSEWTFVARKRTTEKKS